MDCKVHATRKKGGPGACDIALCGNPNVGKSCLFNHLTGMGATVSNFPGTTVDILEGTTSVDGKNYTVADLPGVYSLDDTSPDVKVTRLYLATHKPKAIVNILNAVHLERNLYLTLELMKTGIPVAVGLNFYNEAVSRGISIDAEKLSSILGVPVVPVDAVSGSNIGKLVSRALSAESRCKKKMPCSHQEAKRISGLVAHGSLKKRPLSEKIDEITISPRTGFLVLFVVMLLLFSSLFFLGDLLGRATEFLFMNLIGNPLKSVLSTIPSAFLRTVLDFGLVDGINAALQVAIPYISVFYVMMAILEDSGYLPRMAFLLDRTMHRLGLHGKSVVPMMLGFGCSVPAIFATRILPSKRERIITAVLINLLPCSARTAIILGATGRFLGWQYAMLIYAIVLALILCIGFILGRYLPGTPQGLVMELPEYRLPIARNVISKTWLRLKDFVFMAAPMVIGGSVVLGALMSLNLLEPLAKPFSPVISSWLMLPASAGVVLIYGVLRKELALEMLILVGGSSNLLKFMTPVQVFVFTLVVTLYFPCITTFTALKHEFGTKTSLAISVLTIITAIAAGGIAGRILLGIGMI